MFLPLWTCDCHCTCFQRCIFMGSVDISTFSTFSCVHPSRCPMTNIIIQANMSIHTSRQDRAKGPTRTYHTSVFAELKHNKHSFKTRSFVTPNWTVQCLSLFVVFCCVSCLLLCCCVCSSVHLFVFVCLLTKQSKQTRKQTNRETSSKQTRTPNKHSNTGTCSGRVRRRRAPGVSAVALCLFVCLFRSLFVCLLVGLLSSCASLAYSVFCVVVLLLLFLCWLVLACCLSVLICGVGLLACWLVVC